MSNANRITQIGFKQYWIGYCGLVRKEVQRFLRIWPQTLIPSAITMTLYFMIFGQVIGQRIGNMGGVDYMTFITPGLIMMAVITNSFSNVVGSFYIIKYNRSIEELLVSPLPNSLIILGYISGGTLRGLLVGLITAIIGSLFSGMHIAHLGLSLFVILLTSILFCLAGLINAIFAKSFDGTSIVVTFVLTQLIYLGGVFYSVNLLGGFWQTLSHFNPIFYMIHLFRYAMLGQDKGLIYTALGILIALVILFYGVAWLLLSKGVRVKA